MTEQKKLSERIKWKAFRLHPADRDSVVVSKATLDRWINEIATLEKRLAEAGWQPIETAPKDGTSVLVFPATWGSKSASIAKWYEDKYARKPRPHWSRDDDLGKMTISRKNPPTHWMPLPPPPQENTHD